TKSFAGMSIIGLLAGFLVGMTSVGSGSIVMMLLLIFYSFSPRIMVGTDIVHAVILTGVTSLMHFRLHNIDKTLVASLLIGSVPGGLLGSHLSTRVPVLWLRRILCTVLLMTGARMLWG
ncbi:MAG: sulfite exporter TauE/SafE family protein, partial [Acidobacteriales bacterium]|nr:sulfite exporter TauE/SafE family protein [Terriglobales bacterium]